MSLREEFGQKIKNIRNSMGLSQEKFAELVGMQTRAIGFTESGKSFPTVDNLEKIQKGLGIEYSELFNFNAPQDARPKLSNLQRFVSTFTEAEADYFTACAKEYMKLKRKQK